MKYTKLKTFLFVNFVVWLLVPSLSVGQPVQATKSPQIVASPQATQTPQAFEPDVSTLMMNCTFEIIGPRAGGATSGTGFVVGKPAPTNPKFSYFVLVTADHVFEAISGQQAIVVARQQQGDAWGKVQMPLQIRGSKNEPLWVKHPSADVAAMYVSFPKGLEPKQLLDIALFGDDKVLKDFDVRPGDRVFVLGFPLGFESPSGGFPILRAGEIASYPLVPSRSLGKLLVSFKVFPGNSGGPVFLIDYNRVFNGGTHIGVTHFIVGLVSEQTTITHQDTGLYSNSTQQYPLDIAVVVPASLIVDTINMLPSPPPIVSP